MRLRFFEATLFSLLGLRWSVSFLCCIALSPFPNGPQEQANNQLLTRDREFFALLSPCG
ncbi:hypothetical protein Z948_704 [Sulfitobacter donghicola DSW-25 = KCTC 12864 = JCM 14565]|uniref:Uncharacterized protein n=1 Tax=Sulfitobacter donghicola DSW-25 = KCTC 12864 = JCM 14565 TaxID=1300350 RepID=A0A073IJ04_9RHOB|nr:hypothetical protein DSW25_06600 [Sulfitobacter donghicola DSW-25 = KCTC 12864 = JCM 14565]KIN67000.1 hypothetical protein Z948_704 [Sulfitobacter donghicola DSW-25 = KCTC 12864 = JCM 14565]